VRVTLRRRDVALVTWATSRTKVVEIPDGLEEAVTELLAR
jgi:uncharacterized protein YggU (UPF0235/DUF167 family)